MDNKPTLGYWNIRGLVSNVKYQLAYCGIEYNMKKYALSEESGKYSCPEWKSDKVSLGMDFPNLPYFIDGDVKISETLAIHHYIAQKYKPELLGASDSVTQAKLQMLNYILYEFKWKQTMPCYTGGTVEEILKIACQKLPAIIKFMGESKFLSGDTPVYQDFYFFEAIQMVIHFSEGQLLKDFPALQRFHNNMRTLPGLKEYLETCDDKDMPFNNIIANCNGKADYDQKYDQKVVNPENQTPTKRQKIDEGEVETKHVEVSK